MGIIWLSYPHILFANINPQVEKIPRVKNKIRVATSIRQCTVKLRGSDVTGPDIASHKQFVC